MEEQGRVILGECFEEIEKIEDNSLSAVITDPPYFLDGMGNDWDEKMTGRLTTKKQVVGSLRSGMKFNKQQGLDFQSFMQEFAEAAYTKLKPGGWFVAFSAPRLYHRLAVGVEDAGYEIRDMWEWLYTQNQMKAMSVKRSLLKDDTIQPELRKQLEKELDYWKTPQVKSCFEPIVIAQKPREGTFYDNWKKHHIGMINVKLDVGEEQDMATSNVITTEKISENIDPVFLIGKPTKKEKGETKHLSVKPILLMQHIVQALVPEEGLILDPFNGSGTTGIATIASNRKFIGFEKNQEYFSQSLQRNRECLNSEKFDISINEDHTGYSIFSQKDKYE